MSRARSQRRLARKFRLLRARLLRSNEVIAMSKTLYAGMMLCIFCAVMHLSAQGGGDAKLERFDVGASYGVHFGVDIVSVDADKGIIVFIRKNGAEQKVQVVKDCVCKVGSYHYGKPASTMEGKE